ncbi:MAG: hypothetical protein L3J83_04475 [Proteobacteria bacterium]|nr:hypothetical protein [Pseudomonadota bacterium]
MEIFCLEIFKTEFDALKSKRSYRSLEQNLIDYFFERPIKELRSGTRLNNNDETPYIKKRLNGSGGFRIYFLLIIKNEKLYLMFVHPKTGSKGSSNITDDSKSNLYKKVLQAIRSKELYKLELNDSKDIITFSKLQKGK